jgi:nitrogen fixation protein NifU and related proteins
MSNDRLYEDLVMEHIRNARNFRALPDSDRHASGTNVMCGDELGVYLKLADDRIAEAAFQCTCCGIAMASASMMTERVCGKPVAEARDAVQAFFALMDGAQPDRSSLDEGLAALVATVRQFPVRAPCARLAWVTLRAALDGEASVAV